MQPPELTPTELQDQLLSTLRRAWKLIVIVSTISILSAYVAISFLGYKYESSALLLVQLGRENSQPPIAVEKGEIFSNGGVRKEEINSYISVLTSRSLILETIHQFNPAYFEFKPNKPETVIQYIKYYTKSLARWARDQVREVLILIGIKPRISDEEKVAQLIHESLVVRRETDSNVIKLSLQLPDPGVAKEFLDRHIEQYLLRHIAMHEVTNIETAFRNRAALSKSELLEKQVEMERIRQRYSISSVLEQRSELIKEIQGTKRQLYNNQSLIDQERRRRTVLQTKTASLQESRKQSEVFEQNPQLATIQGNLTELRIKLATTLSRYERDSNVVAMLHKEIEALEDLKAKEKASISTKTTFQANPLAESAREQIQEIDVSIAGLEAAIHSGRRILGKLNEELQHLNTGSDKLDLARIEYTVLEQKYFVTNDQLERVKVDTELDAQRVVNVSILTSPSHSLVPVAPNKFLLFVIGIIASMILAVSIAMIRDWLSDVVHDSSVVPGILLGEYSVKRYVNPAI